MALRHQSCCESWGWSFEDMLAYDMALHVLAKIGSMGGGGGEDDDCIKGYPATEQAR